MAHGLTRASVFIAATTLLLATSWALGDDRPAPGAYEITTATTYTDVPLPDTTFTTTSCLTAEDLNRDPAGSEFSVSWRVKNSGDVTWGAGYQIKLIHEAEGSWPMAAQRDFPLTVIASHFPVLPGEDTNITLQMTAPLSDGR